MLTVQETESQLRLEVADLTQRLAASWDGGKVSQETLTQAEQAAALSKTSITGLQEDLAKMTLQRDAAWKVPTLCVSHCAWHMSQSTSSVRAEGQLACFLFPHCAVFEAEQLSAGAGLPAEAGG